MYPNNDPKIGKNCYYENLFSACDWWKAVNCGTSHIDSSEAVVYGIPLGLLGSARLESEKKESFFSLSPVALSLSLCFTLCIFIFLYFFPYSLLFSFGTTFGSGISPYCIYIYISAFVVYSRSDFYLFTHLFSVSCIFCLLFSER